MIVIKIEEIADGDVKFTVDNLDTSTNVERDMLLLMREGLNFHPKSKITQQWEDEDD